MAQKFTQEEKKMAVDRYDSGESASEIAEDIGCCRSSIYSWIDKFDVSLQNPQKSTTGQNPNYSDEFKRKVVEEYVSGLSSVDLHEKYEISAHTAQDWVRKYGENVRSLKEANTKYKVNHEAFSELDEETKYWIGFLMADGNVTHDGNGSSRLTLCLSWKDIAHLYKFRRFLGSEHKIAVFTDNKGYHGCRIQIKSDKAVEDLEKYGIVPAKTLTAEVKKLQDDRHFWRGVVDGDGWVRGFNENKREKLTLYGSKKLLKQFKTFCRKKVKTDLNIRKKKGGNVYIISKSHNPAKKILTRLYKNCSICLERKNPFK